MILLFRVDDRLVHGQVAVGWKNALDANHLLVIDNEVASNEFDRTLMEMSAPYDLRLNIMDEKEAARKVPSLARDAQLRTIVLVRNPDVVEHLIDEGVKIEELNIGGMRFSPGKSQVTRAVYLNSEDVAKIKDLARRGIKIEGRIVPTDKKSDFLQLL
ncbi:MAG TPA: PTS sugar transporter subunit IIB [Candidatus Mcinerneyibacteriales bacterium]|nr:PTS sugar transporter subunit IIB [Candidatus Mcinerneyibacteriales bacterium]HPE20390.1 PTS sugar transporter subunit IIB [Candidatus Mcinerneyibacteriales bacterium]HPJ69549.1 PTS sugar transporter subunit IIB [Candidatus Mcinerneyibacteriales bacterium]HPQ88756.1 PTS sugar transporter subunit IIB [Candidatus Mcinerneyibacteriales bacterium]